jgi:hypothetical protein
MTYRGKCSGGPLHGQEISNDEPIYPVMKHPGVGVGCYKYLQGYVGIWAWIDADNPRHQ